MKETRIPKFTPEAVAKALENLEKVLDSGVEVVYITKDRLSDMPVSWEDRIEVAHWMMEDEILAEFDNGHVVMIKERNV